MFYVYEISFVLIIVYFLRKMKSKRVAVVVLGDIGRSPRMQFHSISLANEGFEVDLIGYGGSVPHAEVVDNDLIDRWEMKEVPAFVQKLPRLLCYIFKVIWQAFFLFVTLVWIKTPSHILLQNPPAMPTIAVCWFVSLVRGSKFIIDWHNYGYTIMGMSLGYQNLLVKFAKWYEHFFGRFSSGNICVTKAMKEDLDKNWKIGAETMYDRPPAIFQTTPIEERHRLFSKLAHDYDVFATRSASVGRTAFSKSEGVDAELLADRPALVISSTSWTEDEDFSLLLNALQIYEDRVASGAPLPSLVCVITGKGPLKAHYQQVIATKRWAHVEVCTPWLEAEDYPKLLGSADLGVCLHMSSSGLDLPMKVVDMFGCALPVCAVDFKCLDELVQHGDNGLVFSSHEQLAEQIQDLLSDFPLCTKLEHFRKNLHQFQQLRWDEAWKRTVRPLFV